jgi:mono/diheme cytochrome c family protein
LILIPAVAARGQVEFLDQNWSPETRQAFYTTSQGSRIMPYDWFLALEVSDGLDSFVGVKLPALGYLPNVNTVNNPDRLPVGFVLDRHRQTGAKFIGLTCAACHTNRITYQDKTYQIDGAPTLADMWGMLRGIDESLKATRSDSDKFQRFAVKVLGSSAPDQASVGKLKRELDSFGSSWSQFVEDSRVAHPWGRGRLDAFGMIFNRVSSIDLGMPENSKKPDAPVSYPFLWGTSFQDRVQWNGSAENTNDVERLGRNVGEVLGVFAQAQFRASRIFQIPRPARTSAKRLNQVKLENQLKRLWSPKWPDPLGAIDPVKKAAGAVLYRDNCERCHTIVAHGDQNTPIDVSMTRLSEVRTDSKMAINAAVGKVSTGDLKRLFGGRKKVPRGEMLQRLVRLALISPYRDVAEGDLLDQLESDDVFSPVEIAAFTRAIGFDQREALELVEANQKKLKRYYKDLRKTIKSVPGGLESTMAAADAPPTLEYKAAPLAGIWATAPYLHNGSVPNLYELLLPAEQRSSSFHVGSTRFDPVKVGFETGPTEGTTLIDTTKEGNRNSGHDMYGEFSEQERWQLVEYMKSL